MNFSTEIKTRLQAWFAPGQRRLLGLVGPPGAGKSTVAQAIADVLPAQTQIVPMDGFHLAQAELERLGRAQRKGAHDTFDSAGYVALLQRIRHQRADSDEVIYAPAFRREIEEPIAGAIPVHGATPLIVTEGNYLLLEQGAWAQVRAQLDEVWYVDVDEALRTEWLLQRHVRFGRSLQQARDWVAQTDTPNARLIAATRKRADRVLPWPGP